MEPPADPYDHPEGVDCIYVQTSVFSNDDVYDVKCSCVGESACGSSESCVCLKTCGVNYHDEKLVEEKLLSPSSSIFECCDACGCGDSCLNKVSQKGPCVELRIVLLGPKGYGVFAETSIPKGTFLCEYAGEILSAEEMLGRRPADTDWRYVITLNEMSPDGTATKTFIDASKFGNVGRYLNHSCDPNSILVPIRYENVLPKVGIFALRDIEKGEECCYLYASGDSDRSETPCHCGSEKCCGFLPLGCSSNLSD